MGFPEYSKVAVADSPEHFEDEELPSSSSSSSSSRSPRSKNNNKNKKTSIICGWTFWLFLLILFALGGIGFVMLKDDPNHNLLAKLSLGDADEDESNNYDQKMNRIKQDESSDYSSSTDSGSSDSSNDNTTDEGDEAVDESKATEDENDSTISNSESNAHDSDENSDIDDDTVSDDEDEEPGAATNEDEDEGAASKSESNDGSESTSNDEDEASGTSQDENQSDANDISDSIDADKNEADDDTMMFDDSDGDEGEQAEAKQEGENDTSESNDGTAEEADSDSDDESVSDDEDEDPAAEDEENKNEDGDTDSSDADEEVLPTEASNLDEPTDSTDGESTEDHTPPEAGVNSYDDEETDEEEIIAALRKRLEPKGLDYEKSEISDLRPHQFLHLHQMKTGGTSVDHYLRCAMDRLRVDKNLTIPYGNIHECSELRYSRCRDEKDPWCKERLVNASFMSYCAPLKDLELFKWSTADDDIRAITVLRNPVDRVWSMYRFQTKSCYDCMSLADIYDLLDHKRTGTFKNICMKQLMNHETANMLSHSDLLPKENAKYQQEPLASSLVNEAVVNMKSFFTAIGLTEELNRTVDLFGEVFPWFQSEVEWSDMTCGLTHDNASPLNNHCGPNNTHMELPPHPDEATRKLIEEHNQLDIAVYEAAVRHFWRQNDAVYNGKRR